MYLHYLSLFLTSLYLSNTNILTTTHFFISYPSLPVVPVSPPLYIYSFSHYYHSFSLSISHIQSTTTLLYTVYLNHMFFSTYSVIILDTILYCSLYHLFSHSYSLLCFCFLIYSYSLFFLIHFTHQLHHSLQWHHSICILSTLFFLLLYPAFNSLSSIQYLYSSLIQHTQISDMLSFFYYQPSTMQHQSQYHQTTELSIQTTFLYSSNSSLWFYPTTFVNPTIHGTIDNQTKGISQQSNSHQTTSLQSCINNHSCHLCYSHYSCILFLLSLHSHISFYVSYILHHYKHTYCIHQTALTLKLHLSFSIVIKSIKHTFLIIHSAIINHFNSTFFIILYVFNSIIINSPILFHIIHQSHFIPFPYTTLQPHTHTAFSYSLSTLSFIFIHSSHLPFLT